MLGVKYFDVYAWATCPWCARAVNLLRDTGFEFSLTLLDNSDAKHHELKQETGWQTVPIVIEHRLDGESKLVGGYTDLVDHLKDQYGICEGGEE